MKSLNTLNTAIRSTKVTRCRRATLAVAISLSSLVGISAIGVGQASATTSAESTSYTGPCVGNAFGSSNVECLPSRLTSTGVSEFEAELLGDPNNASCFANISYVYGAGYYLDGSSWIEGSGGDASLSPAGYGDWFGFASDVVSGTKEQVVDQFCDLDFNVTY